MGKERVPFDFYPTPPWCVERLLERHGEELLGSAGRVLEPTVGDGAIVRAARAWQTAHGLSSEWTGVELRRGALLEGTELDRHIEGVDFRSFDSDALFDVAILNPPFKLAEPILRRCLELSRVVVSLLRLGFLSSADRIPFWSGPGRGPLLRVLPDRPSFDGDGTDSATYAWFVWGLDLNGPAVDTLGSTPQGVRAAQKPQLPTGLPQLGLNV